MQMLCIMCFSDFALPHAKDDTDLLWFEREDFDIERSDDDDPANEPDNKRKNKKVHHKQPKGFSGENTYPEDLWHILSIFIRPEGVLNFALICKGSLNAVSSIRFWLRLYNIYVQDQEKLPSSLRPDRVDCGPGLRARVVRALFYSFDTLKKRLVRKVKGISCMDGLLYWTCCSMWFRQTTTRKETKIWMFYFRFCQSKTFKFKPERYSKKWLESADFLRDNPEEGLPVLAVSCLNFVSFQPVLGMVLSEGLVGLSQNMKNYRVKLMFHNERTRDQRYRPESGFQVILDPVQDVNVMDWWHPLYPHIDC